MAQIHYLLAKFYYFPHLMAQIHSLDLYIEFWSPPTNLLKIFHFQYHIIVRLKN